MYGFFSIVIITKFIASLVDQSENNTVGKSISRAIERMNAVNRLPFFYFHRSLMKKLDLILRCRKSSLKRLCFLFTRIFLFLENRKVIYMK